MCALLSGVSACLLLAFLIVSICWWLFAIATASSHSSILNESHVVPRTNHKNFSQNDSLIIDKITSLSLLPTVSSKSFQYKTSIIYQNSPQNNSLITTVSSKSSLFKTSIIYQNSSQNNSLIIAHLTNLSVQTTVSTEHSYGTNELTTRV